MQSKAKGVKLIQLEEEEQKKRNSQKESKKKENVGTLVHGVNEILLHIL